MDNHSLAQDPHNQFLVILDSIDGPIYVADMDTHNILYANDFIRKKFGEDILHKKCYKVLQGKDSPCEFCTNAIIRDNNRQPYYWEFKNKLNNSVYQLMDRVIKWNNEKDVRLEIGLDITQMKKAEEERLKFEKNLYHIQKLESLGVLTGGIAHDFNNLLMGILGNVSLMDLEVSDSSPLKEYLEEITKITQRAADLTRQLLAYAGKGKFLLETIDINKIITECTSIIMAGSSKKAKINFYLTHNLPNIQGDPSQIQQVLLNLILNAIEALEDNEAGTITISTGIRNCDESYFGKGPIIERPPPGRYVFVEISDTGIGMTPEVQKKIFDPFFTTKFTGRGLGLAAVLGIVRAHHGGIMVYSELNKGTTMKVLFPPTKSQKVQREIQTLKNKPTEKLKGTILFVDDELMVRKVGKNMLYKLGYSVLIAENGSKAIEMLKNHKDTVQCVILDLTMPEMDGYTTFSRMKQIAPGIKIIISSGYNSQNVSQRFVGKKVAGFIQKPYQIEELEEKLDQLLI